MEKVKKWIFTKAKSGQQGFQSFFSKKETEQTSKRDFNWKNIVGLIFFFMISFCVVVLFLPTKEEIKFRETAKNPASSSSDSAPANANSGKTANKLWATPGSYPIPGSGGGGSINYNTPMVVSAGGNSHMELHAGTRLQIQILDKFFASQEPVPVAAKVVEAATSESGLQIPEGSILYGEASYQKGSGRAAVQFKQISYPSGKLRVIAADVVSPDGTKGLIGSVHSDGIKNTTGQVITTFVSGMASGSMQRDLLGNSTGGLTNGLLQAVSDTAKDRAQRYGESLKEAREWIEIPSGTECEAIIQQSYKMTESESN